MDNSPISKYLKTVELANRALGPSKLKNLSLLSPQLQSVSHFLIPQYCSLIQSLPINTGEIYNLLRSDITITENMRPYIESLHIASIPAMTYLKSHHHDIYSQIHDIASLEQSDVHPIPCHKHERKVNTRRAYKLLRNSKYTVRKAHAKWANLSESKFSMILLSLDRIIDTLDEPMSTQLSIFVVFLTILFIYTHTSDDTPGK